MRSISRFRFRVLLSVVGLSLMVGVAAAEVYTIDTKAQWERWTYPEGLMEVTEDGGIRLNPLRKTVNAVADAEQFKQEGGIVRTGSNPGQGDRIADEDVLTWWKPRESDGLDRWWIDVDLGRAVLARKIRLTFPDTVGARPFRYFSVWTSPGIYVLGVQEKILRYARVGSTIGANEETVVEFDLSTYNPSPATGAYLNTADTLYVEPLRYVRFVADSKNADAALAEIEVETVGYNIAIKAAQWGGGIEGSKRTRGAESLIDGNLRTSWGMEWSPEQTWRAAGTWWKLDLGGLFYIDRIVLIPHEAGATPYPYGLGTDRVGHWEGLTFLTSDGAPSGAVGGTERAEGDFKYELLSKITNNINPRRWLLDLSFPTRRARYVFWHMPDWGNFHQWLQLLEIFVYAVEGFPGQVELTSEWMDFDEARSFSAVAWEADLPAETRIEVVTRTGNTLDEVEHYFTNTGVEVTEERYKKLPPPAKGEITRETRIGSDWSGWSQAHRVSGQAFLSPTPRRYVQAKVFLYSDDPQVAPTLHSLSFVYNPPLIKEGVSGRILPREGALDLLETFQYTLWPKYKVRITEQSLKSLTSEGVPDSVLEKLEGIKNEELIVGEDFVDSLKTTIGEKHTAAFKSLILKHAEDPAEDLGFDQVLIRVPSEVEEEEVSAKVGGEEVDAQVRLSGDSLFVQLSQRVTRDSVEVTFEARVFENPTVFDVVVMDSQQPERWQGVVPLEPDAEKVFVPSVYGERTLIRKVSVDPEVITPNGDGTGESLRVRFDLVKVLRAPEVANGVRVRIYTLHGQLVKKLSGGALGVRYVYEWDGKDEEGALVLPGLYLLQICVDADAGSGVVNKLVCVVY